MAEVARPVAESTSPAVIFDVDGVLRVDTETKPDGYVRHPVYPMYSYNPALRAPLGNLLENTDGYYVSGWRQDSHEHGGEVLLLPELDWINSGADRLVVGKPCERALAITALFGDRPIIWFDDEITDEDRQHIEQRGPALAPPIDPEIGLTPRNVELENKYNKLEVQRFQEEIEQMNTLYGGVKELNARPGAVFIVDIIDDANAVREAKKLGVPIVAMVDTNADPSQVTYPIPANDDAIKTIQLVVDYVQAAIETGKAKVKAAPADDKAEKAEAKADKPEKIEKVKV